MALMGEVSMLTATVPLSPLEVTDLDMVGVVSPAFPVEASLTSRPALTLSITHLPPFAHVECPLEFGLSSVGRNLDALAGQRLASYLSDHAQLTVSIATNGQPPGFHAVALSARTSPLGWTARALIPPSSWSGAISVTVVSFSIAGLTLHSDCLPATLRVGYNHALARPGAVLAAARIGDVAALQAALDAGGSTEETDADGGSPALVAAWDGHLVALRLLLAAGANPATIDKNGGTPLHGAAYYGHAPVVALLLATPGVDPLARDAAEGLTPLDCAKLESSHASAGTAALLEADPRVAAAGAHSHADVANIICEHVTTVLGQ